MELEEFYYIRKEEDLPISDILKDIINITPNSKTVDPQSKTSLFSGNLYIICHPFCKRHLFAIYTKAIPAKAHMFFLITKQETTYKEQRANLM